LAQLFEAREAFSPNPQRVINAGEVVSSDDPDYQGREHLFKPVTAAAPRNTGSTGSETASAAPGERRVRSGSKAHTQHENKSEETGS
jgi:hypothetical protein